MLEMTSFVVAPCFDRNFLEKATMAGSPHDHDLEKHFPLIKLHANLKSTSSSNIAVLVLTGALNPIHEGHITAMNIARERLQEEGFQVVAGYLSPSHRSYVEPKMRAKGGGELYLSTSLRLECVQAAVAESEWLNCAAWESDESLHSHWPDYPLVVRALATHLSGSENCRKQKIKVFFVCGYDHALKCGLLRSGLQEIGVLVVPRGDDHPKKEKPTLNIFVGRRAPPPISSTLIRKYIRTMGRGCDLKKFDGLLHPDVTTLLLSSLPAAARPTITTATKPLWTSTERNHSRR